MRRLRFLALLAVPLALSGARGSEDPFEIWDQKAITAALEGAEYTLKEQLGGLPPKKPRILLSTREFFEGVAYKATKRMENINGPQDEYRLRAQARSLARGAFGYYEAPKNTIHLLPENFYEFALRKEEPRFKSSSYLQIVLTHEMVHAWDEQRYKSIAVAEKTSDPETYKVFYALIEGHAMWVTEKATRKAGLEKEFRLFTDASFNPPPGLSAVESQFAYRASAGMRFGYVDGHRFFTGLEASDDPDIVDKAFNSPPKSVSVILHPTRYFMPEESEGLPPPIDTKPALLAALERENPGGTTKQGQWDEQVLKARMVMLQPSQVTPVLSKLVKGIAWVSAKKKSNDMIACSTAQMSDADTAKDLFEMILDSEKAEDRAISEVTRGKIESGRLSGPLRPNSRMPHNRTRMFLGEGRNIVPQNTVLFAAGPFVAECTLIGLKTDDGKLEDLITFFRQKLVDVAKNPPRPAPAATPAPKNPGTK